MTNDVFNTILDSRLQKIRDVLAVKGEEYASNDDRLHNFKEAAKFLCTTPIKACLTFLTKHLVSVVDLTERVAAPYHLVDEKIGDAINYLVLLEALFVEEKS